MSGKLYACVSDQFDRDGFHGLLMAAETAEDANGFTELGYGSDGTIVEVVSKATNRFASEKDVVAAAEAAGLRVFATYDDYERETGKTNWDDDDVFVAEHKTLNRILEAPGIQKAVEAAGFHAARDSVIVTNYEVVFSMFWDKETFEVSSRVPAPAAWPAR